MIAIKPCIERKQYLSGVEERFVCEWVIWEKYFGILKHIAELEYSAGNLLMAPGFASYRFYWPNRYYNLYKLYNDQGVLLGNLFNLADSIAVSEGEIIWRDLNVDLLVLPNGEYIVVDGTDGPAWDETWLHIFIEANKQELLRRYQEIIRETDQMLFRYGVV